MNKAIIVGTWRYMLHSPLRLLMFGLFLLATYFAIHLINQGDPGGPQAIWVWVNVFGNLLVWTLGAGLIRNDRVSGVLALVLLRPLSRLSYTLSKWLALTLACWAVLALVALLDILNQPSSLLGQIYFWQALGGLLLLTASSSALLTLISALPLGFGDLGILAIFMLVDMILGIYGSTHGMTWMNSAASFFFHVVLPHYPTPDIRLGLDPSLWPDAAMQLGAGLAALLGAVWFTQRLELNYGEAN